MPHRLPTPKSRLRGVSPGTLIRLFLALGAFLAINRASAAPEPAPPVRLQLKWANQFQFAGYHAAQAKVYYARENLAEIVELILAVPGLKERGVTREQLLSEAAAMRPFVLSDVVDVGHVNHGRWRRIADILVAQGLAPAGRSLDDFVLAPDPQDSVVVKNWIRRALVAAVTVSAAALLAFIWIMQMRRMVAARTTALRDEIALRERAEAELRAGKNRLKLAQTVAKVGSWETDLRTGVVRWSDETHRIFGTDAASFPPTHAAFLGRVHPEDRPAVESAFQDSFGTRESCLIEHRIVLPDGQLKNLEERWRIQTGPDGTPVLAVGTCQDITERRLAEAGRRLLENCVSRLNDLVIITSADELSEPGPRIIFVNDAFERLTGYTRGEALGRSPRFLQGPKTSREALERIRIAILAGRPVHEEVVNYAKDGREYWVDINISPVRDTSGTVTHLVAIQRDVTERKKLEDQFLRAQRMESIGTLAGGIAHDLNNLLAPVIMGVDLLRQLETRPETHKVLDNMERSARRGADLVRQVLSFARGVQGERVALQLHHIVREIETMIENTFPKNIRYEGDCPKDLRLVLGDPTQLNQVLLNLCVNARDAMPAGGVLSLKARNIKVDAQFAAINHEASVGRYICVEVADTGCGMSHEIMTRIFEPFFTTKAQGSGTGLGLSTVMGIVRGHGGFVNVCSEAGKGSTFKVYLPATDSECASAEEGTALASLPRGKGELVLVVDDEPSILNVTSQTLEAFGYRTLAAEDGAQAFALYNEHRDSVAAVLTDMMMPVMDGPALISALRHIDPRLPIVAASGLASHGGMARIASVGVSHFLAKPYHTDALLKMLRRSIDETHDGAA